MSDAPVAQRPFPIVLVSDLLGTPESSGPAAVDPQELAGLLARWRPRIAIALPDPLGGGGEWELALEFDSLRAFEPAGLLAQVPLLATRREVLRSITSWRRGEIEEAALQAAVRAAVSADAALAWLESDPAGATPSGPASSAGAVAPAQGASILDLIDDPDPTRQAAADVERLAAAAGAAGGRLTGREIGRWDAAARRLEVELQTAAAALAGHPDVRRLEAGWRGVQFLVQRCDFRAGIELSLLHAPRAQAVRALAEQVITPAFDGERPTPGLIVFDYVMANTPADLALLDELAQQAQSLPAPVTFPLEVAFFNVKSPALLKNLPNLSGLIDTWPFAKWRTLREQRYSRMLLPVFGRMLARAPHPGQKPGAAHELTWLGGHLALAFCAARSFAAHGWPTRMFGAEAGKVENLAVVPNPHDPQRPWGPGDTTLPDARVPEFFDIGVNLLQSLPGRDCCILLGGVSAARPMVTPETPKQQALLEVSAPYQQFSSLLGSWLFEQIAALRGRSEVEVQQHLLFGLRDLLRLSDTDDPESILVGVGDHPDAPGQKVVQLRITPPGRIAPGGLHVDFSFAV